MSEATLREAFREWFDSYRCTTDSATMRLRMAFEAGWNQRAALATSVVQPEAQVMETTPQSWKQSIANQIWERTLPEWEKRQPKVTLREAMVEAYDDFVTRECNVARLAEAKWWRDLDKAACTKKDCDIPHHITCQRIAKLKRGEA